MLLTLLIQLVWFGVLPIWCLTVRFGAASHKSILNASFWSTQSNNLLITLDRLMFFYVVNG